MKSYGEGGIPDGIYLPQDFKIHLLPKSNHLFFLKSSWMKFSFWMKNPEKLGTESKPLSTLKN